MAREHEFQAIAFLAGYPSQIPRTFPPLQPPGLGDALEELLGPGLPGR